MYSSVSDKLAVLSGTPGYSQAVSMAGGNAVAVDLTVFSGTVTVTVEESNDLQNWDDAAALDPPVTGGVGYYFGATQADIAAQYVRLKYVASSDAVVGAGINVANL